MFKIIALIVATQTSAPVDTMRSKDAYPTLEACEAARPDSIKQLAEELSGILPYSFTLTSKCELQGNPA